MNVFLRIAFTVACALALSLFAAPIASATDYWLSENGVDPANGAVFSATDLGPYWPDFIVDSQVPGLSSPRIEISTSNIEGQDGSLAEDFVVQTLYSVSESDAYPGAYVAASPYSYHTQMQPDYSFITTPGTYYWQLVGTIYENSPCCSVDTYFSQIYSFTVTAPLPPPPAPNPTVQPNAAYYVDAGQAPSYIKRLIRRRYRGTRISVSSCVLNLATGVTRCRATWRRKKFKYTTTFRLTADANTVYLDWSSPRKKRLRR